MDDVGLSVLRLLFHGFRFWGFALFAFGPGNGLPKKGPSFFRAFVFGEGCLDRLSGQRVVDEE